MHFVEKFGKIGTLLSAERNERGESISVSIFSPTSWFASIKKTADEDEAIRWKWRSDLGGNFRRSCLTEETDSALLATKRQKFYDFWAEQHFCSCKKVHYLVAVKYTSFQLSWPPEIRIEIVKSWKSELKNIWQGLWNTNMSKNLGNL